MPLAGRDRTTQTFAADGAGCPFASIVTYGKGYYKMFDLLKPGIPISAAWVVLMTVLMVLIGPLIGLL